MEIGKFCLKFEEEIGFGVSTLTGDYLPAGIRMPIAGMELDLNENRFRFWIWGRNWSGFEHSDYLPAGSMLIQIWRIEPKNYVCNHHGRIQKCFVVEFNSTAQGSKNQIEPDEMARNIIGRNIQRTDYIKKFNFKDLCYGTYFFSVENALSSVVLYSWW